MSASHGEILELGHPALRRVSEEVTDVGGPTYLAERERLVAAFRRFRAEHGFGRAMAAPQIGILRRMIVLQLGEPVILLNPEIVWQSDRLLTVWDDCMCFPHLMVRVERYESITVRYVDEDGQIREWANLDPSTSELMQHEIDHLDGVLAVDRAAGGGEAFVARKLFESCPEHFGRLVDLWPRG
jgi:peptide deformylase